MKSLTSILTIILAINSCSPADELGEDIDLRSQLQALKSLLKESISLHNERSKHLRDEHNSLRQKLDVQASKLRRMQDPFLFGDDTPKWVMPFKTEIVNAIQTAAADIDDRIEDVHGAVESLDNGAAKAAAKRGHITAKLKRLADSLRLDDKEDSANRGAVSAPYGPQPSPMSPYRPSLSPVGPYFPMPSLTDPEDENLKDRLDKEIRKHEKLKRKMTNLEMDLFDLKIDLAEVKVQVNESHRPSRAPFKMRCESGVKSSGELESNEISSRSVEFARPFLNTPHVLVAASMAAQYEHRSGVQQPAGPVDFHLRKRHVSAMNFTIEFKTSAEQNAFVFATWMACGQSF